MSEACSSFPDVSRKAQWWCCVGAVLGKAWHAAQEVASNPVQKQKQGTGFDTNHLYVHIEHICFNKLSCSHVYIYIYFK